MEGVAFVAGACGGAPSGRAVLRGTQGGVPLSRGAATVRMSAGASNRRRYEFSSASAETAAPLKFSDQAQMGELVKFRAAQQKKYLEDYQKIMHGQAAQVAIGSVVADPAASERVAQYMDAQKRIAADALEKKKLWEAQMQKLKTPAPKPAPKSAPVAVPKAAPAAAVAPAAPATAPVEAEPKQVAEKPVSVSTSEAQATKDTKSAGAASQKSSGIDIGSVMNKFIDDIRSSRKAQEDDIIKPRTLISLTDSDIDSSSDLESSSDMESDGASKKKGKKNKNKGSKLEKKGFGTKKSGEFDLVELAKSKKLKSLTIAKLKSILEQNNLSTEGKKRDLVERLTVHLESSSQLE